MKLSPATLFLSTTLLLASCCPGQNPTAVDSSTSTDSLKTDGDQKLKALIIDGQNNHTAWPKSTLMMRDYLLDSGRFTVDIERTKYTWKGELAEQFPLNDGKTYEILEQSKTDPDFAPNFSKYDVVISNFGWKAAPWPEATKAAFEDYMKNGGGFVSIHAADNCFPKWEAYNLMTGLGGWDGRQNKGYYLYTDDQGKVIRDNPKGPGGGHGPQREFSVVIRNTTHPITEGLPAEFMHSKDELYHALRGPAENVTILATAYADPKHKGSGKHEPMLMAIEYEKGRVFHSTLGHADYSFECIGFQTTFLRGTEWAATGKVTIPIPDDFPGPDQPNVRKWKREATVAP
jgi:hypothetical protein